MPSMPYTSSECTSKPGKSRYYLQTPLLPVPLCWSQLGELLWHSALQASASLPQLQHSWCLETGIPSSYSTVGAWRQQFPPPSLPQQSKQPLSKQCCTKLWSGRFSCGTNEQLHRLLLPLRATKNVVPRHLRYSDTSMRTLHTARELPE